MDLIARNHLVSELVALLANGEYDALLLKAPLSSVSAEQLAVAVKEYGRQIVPIPPAGYRLIDCVPVQGSKPQAWSVVVPLFTSEEGRSDLSLELSIAQSRSGYTAQIDGIHVL